MTGRPSTQWTAADVDMQWNTRADQTCWRSVADGSPLSTTVIGIDSNRPLLIPNTAV